MYFNYLKAIEKKLGEKRFPESKIMGVRPKISETLIDIALREAKKNSFDFLLFVKNNSSDQYLLGI